MSIVRVSCLAKDQIERAQRVNLDRPILPLGHLVVTILKRLILLRSIQIDQNFARSATGH